MAKAIDTLVGNMLNYRFNAAAVTRIALQRLTELNNGEETVVDSTNPFIQAIEMAAVETTAFMSELEAESRRRYPLMAQTQEDLYLHMSDQDYLNRFATPATATFSFRFFKEQLLNAMILEPETGYLKITIPRNTYITVLGVQWSLQYPIEIRQLTHGGLQIVYNNDQNSVLQTLDSNAIDYEVLTSADGNYVQFDALMTQFSISSQTAPISLSTDLSLNMQFSDLFYYARVFTQNADSTWQEIITTHADDIYDITKPTAVLRVIDKILTVKIPQIYITTGQLSSKIRVDLYQTQGAINMPLGEYNQNSFSITWKSFDPNDAKNPYSAALPKLSVVGFSTDIVIAGANEMPFETLRQNVILNSTGPVDIAITPAMIKTALANKGYDVVRDKDTVTNRVFLATRGMPTPTLTTATTAASTGKQLLTAAASSIETLSVTTDALSRLSTVIDNGSSITITPDTLYQILDGVTQPLAQNEVERLLALPTDKRALEVTQGNYLYTPFHYVLDASNGAFEMRPYYLDNPVAESKVFVTQNDTTLIQVGTKIYGILRSTTGYMIQIVTRSDDNYKAIADSQVFVQLAFNSKGERDKAYINGTLVGKTESGERIYNFDLSTTFNVDADNYLELSKFTMYNTEPRITKAMLFDSFDVLFSTSAVMSSLWTPNDIDSVLGRHLLPQQIAGINQEVLRINFGSALNMLWTRARTVVGSTPYRTWETDVPAFYASDIYLRDENGSALSVVNGEIVSTILHHVNDPVLDGEGNQVFTHRAGDIVYDATGNPTPTNPRGLLRQLDLLLIEGVYWFATDQTTTNYRVSLTKALVSWLINDLKSFTGKLLDQTRIYFYPKTTSGVIPVYVGDGIRKTILAGQAFNVTLAVPKQVFDNTNLRERLTIITISTVSTMLQEKTVSISQIEKALAEAYGTDVIDVQLSGLGGTNNYSVLSAVNDTDRLSIRKRLVALADNTLVAEEDVTCSFVIHDVN